MLFALRFYDLSLYKTMVEQALELRVWGWGVGALGFGAGELADVGDGGSQRGRLEGWLGAAADRQRRRFEGTRW
jgi:hypothetical protein